jgi:hypothetical protein
VVEQREATRLTLGIVGEASVPMMTTTTTPHVASVEKGASRARTMAMKDLRLMLLALRLTTRKLSAAVQKDGQLVALRRTASL